MQFNKFSLHAQPHGCSHACSESHYALYSGYFDTGASFVSILHDHSYILNWCWLGVGVRILDALLLATAFFWWQLAHMVIQTPSHPSRSSAEAKYRGVSNFFLNLVGYATSFLSFIVLFRRPPWFIVIMLVLSIFLAILFNINALSILIWTFILLVKKVARGQVRVLHVLSRH